MAPRASQEEMEMNTFKVGDRVRSIGGYSFDPSTGTIVGIENCTYRVRVDLTGSEWNYRESHLTLIQPEPKPYQFKVGDKGKTRNSEYNYEVLAVTTINTVNVLIVKVIRPDIEDVVRRFLDGRSNKSQDGDFDLMPPTEARTVYLNVYRGYVAGYESKDDALRHVSEDEALLIAHPVTIEVPVRG